jgi:hypothetical protein
MAARRAVPVRRPLDLSDATRRAVQELLATSRTLPPAAVADGVRSAAAAFGAIEVALFLNDYEHRELRSIEDDESLAIDGTLAGRAFALGTRMETTGGDQTTLWLPLIDGGSRLGVLGLTF